jgi:hypothetical protein
MSNEIKRRPEMNLIAIDVDQFWVFPIIKLIERLEKIELCCGREKFRRNVWQAEGENFLIYRGTSEFRGEV